MEVNSLKNTFIVATTVSLVCAVVIATAAVVLKPFQEKNVLRDKQRNILQAAGLYQPNLAIEAQYEKVEEIVYDFTSNQLLFDENSLSVDPLKMAALPDQSVKLVDNDPAKIGSLENQTVIYLVRDSDNQVEKIVLPVRGAGLWSTLYGFLALERDGNTIAGIGFYQHGETPGLGGEVDNPKWKQQWIGKKLFAGGSDDLKLKVMKGMVAANDSLKEHRIDGLAGASLTTRGVDNLVNFWLGEQGFAPLISVIRQGDL